MPKYIKINILGELKRVPISIIHRQQAARAYNTVVDAFTLSHQEIARWVNRARPVELRASERQAQVAELAIAIKTARWAKMQSDAARLRALLTLTT